MSTRILLIGQGIFLDGLTRILGEQATIEIIAVVSDWVAARKTLTQQQPDIIIVDHANAELRAADLSPLLENDYPSIKVIYLTLAENKMVIHDRKQVLGATLTDLLQALQPPGFEEASRL
jgi:DNA-binding NarL/FixJ family response regulator